MNKPNPTQAWHTKPYSRVAVVAVGAGIPYIHREHGNPVLKFDIADLNRFKKFIEFHNNRPLWETFVSLCSFSIRLLPASLPSSLPRLPPKIMTLPSSVVADHSA